MNQVQNITPLIIPHVLAATLKVLETRLPGTMTTDGTGRSVFNPPIRFFCKPRVGTVEDDAAEVAPLLAKVMDALVSQGMVDYGTLAGVFAVPMDGRFLICWYVGSDRTNEELNEFLQNAAFVDEGKMGSGDWVFGGI